MRREGAWRTTLQRLGILLLGAALGAGADRLLSKAGASARDSVSIRPEGPGAARLVEACPDEGTCPCYQVSRTLVPSIIDMIEAMGVVPPNPACPVWAAQERALLSLVGEQDTLEQQLVDHVKEGQPHRTRLAAAFLLGYFQMAKSTELFLDHIDLDYGDFDDGGACHRSNESILHYPAANGLLSIGEPAAEPLLRRLAMPATAVEQGLQRSVIEHMNGSELALRRVRLARDHETDPEKKRRLDDTATWLADRHFPKMQLQTP